MTATSSSERQLLTKYVAAGKLMQVATLDTSGVPALCHVWYAASFSPDRLYFISRRDRDHSVNIRQNGRVAGGIVAIRLTGLGQRVRGVTFKGTATQLPQDEIDAALTIFHKRWPTAQPIINPNSLSKGETQTRMYKISVSEWLLFDEKNFPDNPRRVLVAE
jgi:uncharacterized protein YhbP (UPF0306 family)